MTRQYKATPEQWADAGAFASDTRACILELRARVEALEAGATCPHIRSSDEGTSYCGLAEAQPAPADPLMRSHENRQCSRAIQATADWLDSIGMHAAAARLRLEAEQ